MSTKTAEKETKLSLNTKQFAESLKKVALAGLGAGVLAQEEAEAFFETLVEKGALAEKNAKKLIKDTKKRVEKGGSELEDKLDGRIESWLKKINVASKNDIYELTKKVETLTKRVETLTSSKN